MVRFFLCPEIRQSSPHFGEISLLHYTEKNLEIEEKDPVEKKKSSGDGTPNCRISVPCRGRTCPDYLNDNFHMFPNLSSQFALKELQIARCCIKKALQVDPIVPSSPVLCAQTAKRCFTTMQLPRYKK